MVSSIDGVKGLVVLGHAGEGTFLSQKEQMQVIESFVKSVDDKIPVIAGITLEGTSVAAEEAKRAVSAGASAGLITLHMAGCVLAIKRRTTRPL